MVTNATDADCVFRSRYEDYMHSSKVTILLSDVVMALTIAVGLVSNICVCVCIFKNRHLRTYININLASSSIANLIGCICLLPIRIQLYTGYTTVSSVQVVCGIGTFFRTFCDTMQFFMLALASFERYQAVVNPFQKVGLKKRSAILVTTSWVFALTLGVVSGIMFVDSALYLPCSFIDGTPNWADYDQYLIFPLGMTLLCVIIVLYSLILKTLVKHSLKMTRHTHKRKVAPDTRKVNDGMASTSFIGDNHDARNMDNLKMFSVSFQNTKDSKDSTTTINAVCSSITLNVPVSDNQNNNRAAETTPSPIQDSTIQVVEMDGTVKTTKRKEENVLGAVCLMNKKNRENGRRRVEYKASKKIAILVGTFTCCWIPLPVFVLSNNIIGHSVLSYSMFRVLIFLGTLGSSVIAINPVLHTLLNRPLNSAMRNLLNLDKVTCQTKPS
ncbi:5-hydroxytryptamine receptor 1A-beta-like [Pecten maximus]|uniref:5-hydroxytryptamine receptor 1A-beta-like n=1 Tax=Pecten maximus TaxID=6579 RepID=UPI00145882DE|nr:5-hydroxytryptamine receptor 1A-beta-like [Pecten maximus]